MTKSELDDETICYAYIGSPMGDIMVTGSDEALHLIALPLGSVKQQPDPEWVHDPHAFLDVGQQITEYFAGDRRAFDLPYGSRARPFRNWFGERSGIFPIARPSPISSWPAESAGPQPPAL